MEEPKTKELLTNIIINGEVSKFPSISKTCCVGWVDIVDSTKIASKLSKPNVSPFYCIFLSQMSAIVRESGGVVVKNIGDSLLYYFPKTSKILDRSAFVDSVDCGIKMINHNRVLNSLMLEIGLPFVNYRVSLDYGEITITRPENSPYDDIFGPTVNLCAKMNKLTSPNTVAIGGDLFQCVKSFEEFRFEFLSEYDCGLKLRYPVYNVKGI